MAPSSSSSPQSKSKPKPTTATSPSQNSTNKDTDPNATLSANFAHPAKSPPIQHHHQQQHQQQSHPPPTTVDYDHETYLQLVADGVKTPNQVYREERARHRTSRALDPAIISDPRGVPSSIDFEWAEESQRKTQRSRDVSSI